MKLVILGATGGTGLEIVGRSIERGHCVTTFVRSPERLKRFQDRITIQQGDVLNADVLGRVIQDHDAVVSGFGPRVPITKHDANLLQRFGGTLRTPIWCKSEAHGGNHTMSRAQLTRGFLWFSVLGWGIGLGAKLFDLIVVAGAWGAAPPTSLGLMPYGPRYPINPGDFFQPLSALMVVGILGALISGWKTRLEYRIWLWVPVISFLIIWILTPTVFWPMIHELYGAGSGKIARSDAELIALVRRWMIWDWLRVALIATGFLSSVRALSISFPSSDR